MNKKVVVLGLSGGIDSSISIYLLQKQGYEVVGVTMSIYDKHSNIPATGNGGCYGPKEINTIRDAKKICDYMNIKHYVVDLKKQYKENVINYFCNTYLCGKTPNPCIACNTKIKFGALIDEIKKLGINFDYFSTGHYVRIGRNKETGRLHLIKSLDTKKDQTYFLYNLTQDQLSNLIFPIGEYLKSDIKKLAKSLGFNELILKKESQDFIESEKYSILFDSKNIKKGNILDISGNIIGEHKGFVNYTIGQRKGLNLGGSKEILYVLDIISETNTIIVAPKKYLYSRGLIATNLNWMSIEKLDRKINLQCKIRSSSETIDCSISPSNSSVEVIFKDPQLFVKPGQSVVFYNNEEVVGGGIISEKLNKSIK